ncbi:MAG: SPOR domain-containing protein, partial [Bacteroidota bacterium]
SSTPPISLSETPRGQNTTPTTPANTHTVQFHVQLAASPKYMDTSAPKWQNLGYMIEIITEDKLYKYQARNFSSFQQASDARAVLKAKGFTDAFIVAYQNGKRISIEQAKK